MKVKVQRTPSNVSRPLPPSPPPPTCGLISNPIFCMAIAVTSVMYKVSIASMITLACEFIMFDVTEWLPSWAHRWLCTWLHSQLPSLSLQGMFGISTVQKMLSESSTVRKSRSMLITSQNWEVSFTIRFTRVNNCLSYQTPDKTPPDKTPPDKTPADKTPPGKSSNNHRPPPPPRQKKCKSSIKPTTTPDKIPWTKSSGQSSLKQTPLRQPPTSQNSPDKSPERNLPDKSRWTNPAGQISRTNPAS